jgi:L,D-transpeptidase ErfK/SrfK
MRTTMIVVMMALASSTGMERPTLTGQVHTVTVMRGDTLRSLGSRFGVDPATIARDNNRALDRLLQIGETLRIDNRHIVPAFPDGVSLVVNVPQRMLFAVTDRGVAAYPTGVGRVSWPTPLGAFSIVSREANPTWDVPQSIRDEARRAGRSLPRRVPPGPANPLGAFWLGTSLDGVGIHGTNAPTSTYQHVTHGCIRLHPDDIAALFESVQVGAKGAVLYEPLLVAVAGGEVFLEAHRDVYKRGPRDEMAFVRLRTQELGVYDRVDWTIAARVLEQREGTARAISR